MATGEKILLTLSRQAAQALTSRRLLGNIDTSGNFVLAGAGGRVDGVNTSKCTAVGDYIDVEDGDYLVGLCGGTFAIGDELGSDANSKLIKWVSGKKVGRAETAGSAGTTALFRKYAENDQAAGEMGILAGDGAIPIQANDKSYVVTKGSAAALTLAAPTAGTHDGAKITVTSNTAFAHVITTVGLLQAGTAAVNTATFAAQKGASVTLMAYQGKWCVISANAQTFA
jgi:hypothetical protein